MSFVAEKTKIVFQLRAKGKGLEVRAVSHFGETRVETTAPTNEVLTAWLAQIPGNVTYQTQQEVGAALYNCLTAGETASLVSETLHEGKQQKQPVHFEVRLDKDQIQLAQFPWETIADASGKFLVRDGIVDVTRYIAYPQSPPTLQINYLNKSLLHVMSQPGTSASPISITKSLIDKIETLPQVTFEQLMRKLLLNYTRSTFWGVQFDGQGLLYPRCLKCGANNGEGFHHCQQCGTSLAALAFAKNGAIEWVSATEVGAILYNAQVQLALLMACEMSQYQNSFTFNGLAPELVLAGMPAIIGVQYPISHEFAHNFVSTFYKTLLQQGDLLTALRTARQMAIRDAWYSPVLYLRHQPTPSLTRVQPTYHTRSVDTAVPAQVSPNVSFLVRLWIRRPQTSPAPEAQLKRELNIPAPVHIFRKEAQIEVKFDPVTQVQPVEQRLLRRGEVKVQLDAAGGNVEPNHMTLFIDEQQDAPPAIFKVTARRIGMLPLEFSLWQDGGKITSLSHTIEVVSQQIGDYSLQESSNPVPIHRDPIIIFISESERSKAEELYKLCLTYFNLEELRELCFELNVDYDSLTGEGKSARTEALIRYLHRQSRLGQFAALVRNKRPQVNWPSIEADHTVDATQKLRKGHTSLLDVETNTCPQCGMSTFLGTNFCAYCGQVIDGSISETKAPTSMDICPVCQTANRLQAKFCMRCGHSLSAPNISVPNISVPNISQLPPAYAPPIWQEATGQLTPTQTLDDRYQILGTLGQGGMGAVYKGFDTLTNQLCIIKMHPSKISSEEMGIIKRESSMLARLNHPYLPTFIDFLELPDGYYFITEFIEGKTLQEMLMQRKMPFTEAEVVSWAIQLCDLLDYLHSQTPSIIFRDLKPDNIMVDQQGQIKLIDFGIARFFRPGQKKDTVALGTVGYAPPEQMGLTQTDARSDIYSLGATLFALFTGQDPSSTPFNLPSVSQFNSFISPELEQIVIKATQSDPKLRFQSAREFRSALQTLMTSSTIASSRPSPRYCQLPNQMDIPEVHGDPSRRSSFSWIWFVVVLVILAALIFWGLRHFQVI